MKLNSNNMKKIKRRTPQNFEVEDKKVTFNNMHLIKSLKYD